MTYNQRLELYKGDERFASLEDAGTNFGIATLSTQVKDMTLSF